VDLKGVEDVVCNTLGGGPRRDFSLEPVRLLEVIFGQNMNSPDLPGSLSSSPASTGTAAGSFGGNNFTMMIFAMLTFFTARTIVQYGSGSEEKELKGPELEPAARSRSGKAVHTAMANQAKAKCKSKSKTKKAD